MAVCGYCGNETKKKNKDGYIRYSLACCVYKEADGTKVSLQNVARILNPAFSVQSSPEDIFFCNSCYCLAKKTLIHHVIVKQHQQHPYLYLDLQDVPLDHLHFNMWLHHLKLLLHWLYWICLLLSPHQVVQLSLHRLLLLSLLCPPHLPVVLPCHLIQLRSLPHSRKKVRFC